MTFKVQVKAGVPASVEAIWPFFEEIERWPEWSPIYEQAQGKLGFGAVLTLTERFEGLGARTYTPRVGDWVPYSQIHLIEPQDGFLGRMLGETVIRYIELEALGPQNSIVAIGEFYSGLRMVRRGRQRAPHLRKGFEAKLAALRTALGLPADADAG